MALHRLLGAEGCFIRGERTPVRRGNAGVLLLALGKGDRDSPENDLRIDARTDSPHAMQRPAPDAAGPLGPAVWVEPLLLYNRNAPYSPRPRSYTSTEPARSTTWTTGPPRPRPAPWRCRPRLRHRWARTERARPRRRRQQRQRRATWSIAGTSARRRVPPRGRQPSRRCGRGNPGRFARAPRERRLRAPYRLLPL